MYRGSAINQEIVKYSKGRTDKLNLQHAVNWERGGKSKIHTTCEKENDSSHVINNT